MYFFYADESGSPDCIRVDKGNGVFGPRDRFFVLTAVALFEHRWVPFERVLNARKRELVRRLEGDGFPRLTLAECEIKSSAIRIPKEREKHKLLRHLTNEELESVVKLFYRQLSWHRMKVFTVVMDKDKLMDYMNYDRLHKKAWELLIERIQLFMQTDHARHKGVMIRDDLSKEINTSIAMKHAYFLERGTSSGNRLSHLIEMPLFVRSELSNGIQLADLVAYNFYHAFKYDKLDYHWFQKVLGSVWSKEGASPDTLDGLKIFPPESPACALSVKIGRLAAELRAKQVAEERGGG